MWITRAAIEPDTMHVLDTLFGEALRTGQVTMQVHPIEGGGVTIDVESTRSGTAAINVTVEKDDPNIHLMVGKATSFEFWLKGLWSKDRPAVEEFIATLRAVVAGKFEETVWVKNGEVVKAYGKVYLSLPGGDTVIDMPYWRLGYNPFKPPPKQEIKYAPWDVELQLVHLDPA